MSRTATEIFNELYRPWSISDAVSEASRFALNKHILDALAYGTSAVMLQPSDDMLTVQKLRDAKRSLLTVKFPLPAFKVPKPGSVLITGYDPATKVATVSTKKTKPEKFNTIGVRFLESQHLAKIYTYKVRPGAKVYLGQELVADTPRGPAVVVVVRTDKTPNEHETYPIEGLKYISKKVVAL